MIALTNLIRVQIAQDQEAVTKFRAWMIEKNVHWANITMCTVSSLDAHFAEADAFEVRYFFDTLKMQREKMASKPCAFIMDHPNYCGCKKKT